MIIREAKTLYKKVGTIEADDISTPNNCALALKEFFSSKGYDHEKEHVFVLLLNRKNKLKGIELVSIGTQSSSLVHCREVFKTAIRDSASSIIIAHNHPSGNCAPSNADIRMTKQVKEASNIIGIDLLDHVIFSTDTSEFYSFNDANLV